MGHSRAVALLENASATGSDFTWEGGRSVTVSEATTFPTTLQLQLKTGQGTYISIGSNITANGLSSGLDLPAGTYRMIVTGGSPAAIYVTLCRVMY